MNKILSCDSTYLIKQSKFSFLVESKPESCWGLGRKNCCARQKHTIDELCILKKVAKVNLILCGYNECSKQSLAVVKHAV